MFNKQHLSTITFFPSPLGDSNCHSQRKETWEEEFLQCPFVQGPEVLLQTQ